MADTEVVDPTDQKAEDILESLGLHPAQLKVQDHLASLHDAGAQPTAPPPMTPPAAEPAPPKLAAPLPGTGTPPPMKRPSMFSEGENKVSQKHHFWGGVLKGLDVAGSVIAPGVMQNIPGTMLNQKVKDASVNNTAKAAAEAAKEKADLEHTTLENANLKDPPAKSENEGKTVVTDQGVMQWNPDTKRYDIPVGHAPLKEEMEGKTQVVGDSVMQWNPSTKRYDIPVGKAPTKESTAALESRALDISTRKNQGQQISPEDAAFLKAWDHNKSLNTQITVNAANARADKAGERQVSARQERRITEHDKAYVQPAEAVEKSYEMMDQAYKEFKDAAAQGKTLPTGAQSMLALSTHLSTTFGNVKGARITKDMIQEHLGARSISDAATVAIQKLTNGDVLSPAQWDAFHDLIKQSRDLSWQTAVKEAKRKDIPVDFLPNDLKGTTGDENKASGNELPPQAAAQLQEGHETTFGNGQVWTKKNGQPVQIR